MYFDTPYWKTTDTTIEHEDDLARCIIVQLSNYSLERYKLKYNLCGWISTKQSTKEINNLISVITKICFISFI